MPLTIYCLNLQKVRNITWQETLKIIILSSIAWGLGYGLIWLAKWIIVDILYGKGMIKTALEQSMYRSEGMEGKDKITYIETVKSLRKHLVEKYQNDFAFGNNRNNS